MIGIYKIENTINNKVYIGQSIDIKKRWAAHKRELTNGTHDNFLLQNEWDMYGESAFTFEVLRKCRSIKLNEYERCFIQMYNSNNPEKGYNRTSGNGNTLIDKRSKKDIEQASHKCIVILKNDKINDLCMACPCDCKQSAQNEILMCKFIASTR